MTYGARGLGAALALAISLPAAAWAQAACNSTGTDLTVVGTQSLNTYLPNPLTSASVSAGATSLPVDAAAARGATPIGAGDLVLIVQMQGAAVDTRNQGTTGGQYGDGAGGDDRMGVLNDADFLAGNYEWNVASGPVTGGNLPLRFPTQNRYASGETIVARGANEAIGFRRYQVVRVPVVRDLIIPAGATLTGLPWNGRSGGVVAIDVSRTLNLGGTIDGSGLGFRGGTPVIPCPPPGPSECNDDEAAIKGEGIVGTPTRVYSRALGVVTGLTNGVPGGPGNRGAPGNAGGAPQGDGDSGGGGGGGGGPGGVGAIGPGAGSTATRPRGGAGYQLVTRVFMGGGGGSGSLDDRTTVDAVSGQAGGGIVYVRFANVTGAGAIRSNGDGGASQPQEGGGGGGGGGTIFLRTEVTDLSAITIQAVGGAGANTVLADDGAGGGGGGGFVIIANPTGMVAATPSVNGGAGGVGGGGSGTSGDGGFQQLTSPPINSNCPGTDTDGDNFIDSADEDDDNDGLLDSLETGGLFGMLDPSGDADADGVPNYLDADVWMGIGMAGACVDAAAPAGTCDETPAVIDADMDGVPNHLDLDADGDGITDVFESGGTDADGDGNPDACVRVNARGICLTMGGMQILVMTPPDTDGTGGADYLDADSDGDGIGDAVESNDTNGNGMLNGAETAPRGTDADGDGIDDAYDPDVAGSDPLRPPFAAGSTEDSDGDGTPDWLQSCGDAYVTAMEACDDGNRVDTDLCSNMCLRADGQPCAASSECVNLCDPMRMTCQSCVDDVMGGGSDTGCAAPSAHCDTTGMVNSCQPCVDTGVGTDDGCGGMTTTCETAPATNRCVPCLDTMSGGAMDDGCPGGAPLCDTSPSGGSPTNVCQSCLDTSMAGTDDGCAGAANVCDTSAGSGMHACVECLDSGTLPDNGCGGATPVCVGSGGTQTCRPCEDTDSGAGVDDGCMAGTPFCTTPASGAPVCVECRDSADCATGTFCNPSGTCTPGCTMDSDCAAPSPACDTASMTCVACTDDTDCGGATPTCDTSRFVCVPCIDVAGVPDTGCADPTLPACAGATGPGTAGTMCVECTTSADCGGGEVCEPTSMTCVTCFDSGTDPDTGCTMPTSICDTSSMDGRCVECLGDSDCGAGSMCDTGTNRCTGRPDNDDDGVPDDTDIDDDNDGITDVVEGGGTDWSVDTDGDGTPDYADPDAVDCADADANGMCDSLPAEVDFDGDGIPNHLDLDADGDGAPDTTEGHDADGNGIPDTAPPITFADADGDGLADVYDPDGGGMPAPVQDTDRDGAPDYLDVDDDGDGVHTRFERPDPNGDGDTRDAQDTDDDGTPDYLDTDDDQDDVPTRFEVPDPSGDGDPEPDAQDTDDDGTPDYLDVDDDGDGIPTFMEGPDPNGDGNPDDAIDTDEDGIPDYLDPDGGITPPPMTPGGLAGGALCSATPGSAPLGPLTLVLSVVAGLFWRRRR